MGRKKGERKENYETLFKTCELHSKNQFYLNYLIINYYYIVKLLMIMLLLKVNWIIIITLSVSMYLSKVSLTYNKLRITNKI